ncbi:MAG: tetratricopeptide repeat protein [Oligoflexales bacterium]
MQTFLISLVLGFTACQTAPIKQRDLPHVAETLKLAKIRLNEGRAADALDAIRPLRQTVSNHIDVLRTSGLIHLALENHRKAISEFKAAYRIESSAENALNLSSAMLSAGSPEHVKNILIPHLNDSNYIHKERLYHNLALASEHQKNNKIAIHWYEKALSEYPIFYLSLLQLGRLKMQSSQEDQAASLFERAIASCTPCFDPVRELVLSYQQQHQYHKAIRTLRQHLKVKDITHPKEAHALLRSLSRLAVAKRAHKRKRRS